MQITEKELAKITDRGVCGLYGMWLDRSARLYDCIDLESAIQHVEVIETIEEIMRLLGIDPHAGSNMNTLQQAYCRTIYHQILK